MIKLLHFILNIYDKKRKTLLLKTWICHSFTENRHIETEILFKNLHKMVKSICWCSPDIKMLIRNETIKLDSLSEIIFKELQHKLKIKY